jgi:hypothetical protein
MKKLLILPVLLLATALFAQEKRALPIPASGDVTLPLEEYNKLIELAKKPVIKPEPPLIPYAIRNAELKLRVTSDSVLGTIQCDGEIFAKGITRIPLLSAPAILEARQAGKAIPLERQGGMQTAILSGPAEFSLLLDTGIPLNIETGRASFNLPIPMAGSVRLTLEMPGEHANVNISPGLITDRKSDGGRTIIEAVLAPGQPATAWWTTREVAAPVTPREVRFLSDIKTLVTVGETDLRLALLTGITVIQGEPNQFELDLPAGFEMTGVTGASLESEEVQSGRLILKLKDTKTRNHQFLVSLEKPIGTTKTDIPFPSIKGAQRETGEVLIEGEGTMELNATEGGSVKRMDVKETNSYLRSLARSPLHAAFRYHRQPAEPPKLALEWTRFPDSAVLAAAAERAVATTLVTSEGRSLTEIKLVVKNQAQPFLKVGLPSGAEILTAEVSGEKVKPVQGADGMRIPLLRTGFRPSGAYSVSFVIVHAGSPFAKKGDSELSLPKLGIPVSLLQWEVFLPESYQVKDFGGDAIATSRLPPSFQDIESIPAEDQRAMQQAGAWAIEGNVNLEQMLPGQMGGIVVDASNAVLPGARVTVLNVQTGSSVSTTTDQAGRWVVSNIPSGKYKVTTEARGFQTSSKTEVQHNSNQSMRLNFIMQVSGENTQFEVSTSAENMILDSRKMQLETKAAPQAQALTTNAATSNVASFQRRIAGDLPIQVEVPRTGNSYRFIRPLVIDEETKVTFQYKRKQAVGSRQ